MINLAEEINGLLKTTANLTDYGNLWIIPQDKVEKIPRHQSRNAGQLQHLFVFSLIAWMNSFWSKRKVQSNSG